MRNVFGEMLIGRTGARPYRFSRDVRYPGGVRLEKFGTEAGEPIEAIIARKEQERRANGGIFTWGIGNSIAPGLIEMLRRGIAPEALFSPIASRPRPVDVAPTAVVRWRSGVTLSGESYDLADTLMVTSRARPAHYALICASDAALDLADLGSLEFGTLRNLVSGRPLGTSQVTAVVERVSASVAGRRYVVALRARLVAPYFVCFDRPSPADG